MNKRYFLGFLIIVVIWTILSFFNLTSPLLFPSIFKVAKAFTFLSNNGDIYLDVVSTLSRALLGFIIASLLGIPLGLILGYKYSFYESFEMVIDFFRSLPGTAMFPLFLLVFGIGNGSKIATVVFVSFWIILINTIYGVLYGSRTRKMVAHVFGANNTQIFLDVILYDALPQIFVGLKTTLSICLVVVVVSEMFIGSEHGLGQKLYDFYQTYETPKLYAVLVITGILGYMLNRIFQLAEKRLLHWAKN